jgi:two-component system, NarL family, nitrate/nitrite response regulator NarL
MQNILLIVDHGFYLLGLTQYFGSINGFDVETAITADDATDKIEATPPGLILLDPKMDGERGTKLLKYLRLHFPNIPVILLVTHIDPEQSIEAMQTGVKGIAVKDGDPEIMINAIKSVMSGGYWFESNVTQPALQYSLDKPKRMTRSDELLTKREHEIVDLVCLGLRNRQIADQCSLTEGTVKIHLNSIFRKLSVTSRAELIVNREGMRAKKTNYAI